MGKVNRATLGTAMVVSAAITFALAGPVDDAFSAYQNGDYAAAMRFFRPEAVVGNRIAQWLLGEMYNKGQGVPQDYAEAAKWYRRAAEQGDAEAQFSLAMVYYQGHGVSQDFVEALKWNRSAADQGVARAQFYLGFPLPRRQVFVRSEFPA